MFCITIQRKKKTFDKNMQKIRKTLAKIWQKNETRQIRRDPRRCIIYVGNQI